MVEIDGSYGSGGGQILRTACALSAIIKKPCHIFNIRKSRPKPGLMPQHLLGIQALSQLCNGKLDGDYLSSEEIKFWPGEKYRDSISIDIPTAGSITLVLQALIPPALFAPSPIKITFDGGATDTFFSPTIDYFQFVFLKILGKMKLTENGSPLVEVNILRRGYYPEGGAKVETKVFSKIKNGRLHYQSHGIINANTLKPLNLIERGKLQKILVISGAANVLRERKVAERQVVGVREVLGKLKLPIEEKIEYYDTRCPGSQVCLIAEFENTVIGADNLGKLGKRAEDVGSEAALELLKEQKTEACPHTNGVQAKAKFGTKDTSAPSGVGACLDKHLADQILPYLALAPGKSQITVSEITNHCKTNIWVIKKFIDGKFEIKENLLSWIPKII